MFSFFKKNPIKKLEKEYQDLMEKAMQVQRSGDLKAYAKIIEKSEDILAEIEALKKSNL